jgi:photosystem II stability/assembly factor-like uncharacterized protein
VRAITFSSRGDVFSGGYGWVYRSTDNGGSWKEAITGLAGNRVQAIALNSAGTVFASSDVGGVFRSSDFGESWTDLGIPNHCVQAITVAPNGTIFVGSAPGCGGDASGIFRSTDNGRTWREINGGLMKPKIAAIAINSQGDLFAGTGFVETDSEGEGIWRSTNGGESWTKVNTGLTSLDVWALVITSNGDILAGTTQGLFRSRNNGESWTKLTTGIPDDLTRSIAIKESNGHIFAAARGRGVIRSTDNGDSWTRVNEGLSGIGGVLSLTINANGDVFAAGYGGTYYSTNEGESWIEINTGLRNRSIGVIDVSPDGFLFAGGYASSVYRSVESTTVSANAIIISGAECSGKKLFIFGRNFDNGAVIMMNGEPQKTKNGDDPTRQLIAKKACKRMEQGQPVMLQLRNSDGRLSRVFSFIRM